MFASRAERPLIYRVLGIEPQSSDGSARGMCWRGYAKAFALSNLVVGLVVWVLFMTQAWLPLNPDAIPNMRWDTALHTMVSFLTNTNQQHYSGQAQLSYLSQMVGIVGLQVVTPMMGLALVVATLRGLFGGREHGDCRQADAPRRRRRVAGTESGTAPRWTTDADRDLGNYWADVTRATRALHAAAVPAVDGAADLAGRAVDAAGRADGDAARPKRGDEGAEDPARPGRADGRGQAAGHQRRRLVRPQQRGAAGEPDPVLEPAANCSRSS